MATNTPNRDISVNENLSTPTPSTISSNIASNTSYSTSGGEITVNRFKLSQNLRNRLNALKTSVSFMDGNSEYMNDPAIKEKFNAEIEKIKGEILQKAGDDTIKKKIVDTVLTFKDMDDAKRVFVLCGIDIKEYIDGLAEDNESPKITSNEVTSKLNAKIDDIYVLSAEICKELAASSGKLVKDIALSTKNLLVSYITKGTTSFIAERSSYWTKELTKSVADIQKEIKEDNRKAEEAAKVKMEETKEDTIKFIDNISYKMSYHIDKISEFAKGVGGSISSVFDGNDSYSYEDSSKAVSAASRIYSTLPGIKKFAYAYMIGPFCSICTSGPDEVENFVNGKCNDLEERVNNRAYDLVSDVQGKVFDAVDKVAQTVGDSTANFINTKAKKVIIKANQKRALILNQSIGKAKTAIMTAVGQIIGKLGPAGKPVAKGMKMALDSIKFPGLS